jgi:VWFA-related protein
VSHRPGHRALLVSTLALTLLAVQASGGSADVTYRSSISEVRLTFFATDENHRGVTNLESSDIAVVDDGMVIRRFQSFAPSTSTRLQVVVLVDTSESVLPRFRQEVADVLTLVSQNPSIAEDQLSIISFGGMRSTVMCSGNCRSAAVANQLSAVRADGATPLFDALEFAGKFIAQHRDPEARPVLILFSDGEDTISKVSSQRALDAIFASEAQIYAVDLNQDSRRADGSFALESMAKATGGQHLRVQQGAVEILSAVIEDLRAGYLITYKLPSQNTGFHWVRIFPTRNLKLQFRCRSGYVYQNSDH